MGTLGFLTVNTSRAFSLSDYALELHKCLQEDSLYFYSFAKLFLNPLVKNGLTLCLKQTDPC